LSRWNTQFCQSVGERRDGVVGTHHGSCGGSDRVGWLNERTGWRVFVISMVTFIILSITLYEVKIQIRIPQSLHIKTHTVSHLAFPHDSSSCFPSELDVVAVPGVPSPLLSVLTNRVVESVGL
jgi:hypothetical protein